MVAVPSADLVDGVIAVTQKEFGYQIFNLGESQTVRLSYLVKLLEEALGIGPGSIVIDKGQIKKGSAS